MPHLRLFKFKLKHDNGTKTVKTYAINEESAINNIIQFESCPRHAITKL